MRERETDFKQSAHITESGQVQAAGQADKLPTWRVLMLSSQVQGHLEATFLPIWRRAASSKAFTILEKAYSTVWGVICFKSDLNVNLS